VADREAKRVVALHGLEQVNVKLIKAMADFAAPLPSEHEDGSAITEEELRALDKIRTDELLALQDEAEVFRADIDTINLALHGFMKESVAQDDAMEAASHRAQVMGKQVLDLATFEHARDIAAHLHVTDCFALLVELFIKIASPYPEVMRYARTMTYNDEDLPVDPVATGNMRAIYLLMAKYYRLIPGISLITHFVSVIDRPRQADENPIDTGLVLQNILNDYMAAGIYNFSISDLMAYLYIRTLSDTMRTTFLRDLEEKRITVCGFTPGSGDSDHGDGSVHGSVLPPAADLFTAVTAYVTRHASIHDLSLRTGPTSARLAKKVSNESVPPDQIVGAVADTRNECHGAKTWTCRHGVNCKFYHPPGGQPLGASPRAAPAKTTGGSAAGGGGPGRLPKKDPIKSDAKADSKTGTKEKTPLLQQQVDKDGTLIC
jgi:hypothetical protein